MSDKVEKDDQDRVHDGDFEIVAEKEEELRRRFEDGVEEFYKLKESASPKNQKS